MNGLDHGKPPLNAAASVGWACVAGLREDFRHTHAHTRAHRTVLLLLLTSEVTQSLQVCQRRALMTVCLRSAALSDTSSAMSCEMTHLCFSWPCSHLFFLSVCGNVLLLNFKMRLLLCQLVGFVVQSKPLRTLSICHVRSPVPVLSLMAAVIPPRPSLPGAG